MVKLLNLLLLPLKLVTRKATETIGNNNKLSQMNSQKLSGREANLQIYFTILEWVRILSSVSNIYTVPSNNFLNSHNMVTIINNMRSNRTGKYIRANSAII